MVNKKKNEAEFWRIMNEVEERGRRGKFTKELKAYLDSVGFFDAPASTQYNLAEEGGLLEHSLNVYKTLMMLVTKTDGGVVRSDAKVEAELAMTDKAQKFIESEPEPEAMAKCMLALGCSSDGVPTEELKEMADEWYDMEMFPDLDDYAFFRKACEKYMDKKPLYGSDEATVANIKDSVAILGLLHDVGKAQLYEASAKNEKVYSDNGKKRDELGKFDWVSRFCYKVKDASERDVIGTDGFGAYYAISEFLPLTKEETVALVNQFSATGSQQAMELPNVLSKYRLVSLLHCADVIAQYTLDSRG